MTRARIHATKSRRCPVCNGADGCSWDREDGLVFCRRRQGEQVGFVYYGQDKKSGEWGLYRDRNHPKVQDQERQRRHAGNGKANGHAGPSTDWEAEARKYASQLTPAHRSDLARALNLPVHCLDAIPLLGNRSEGLLDCWTFPMVDGAGRVIGISRRYRNGGKMAMAGSKNGLIVPTHWNRFSPTMPLFVVEGASDVLAMAAIGLPAVGRPSNMAGADLVADLVAALPEGERPLLVVMGEYDPNPKGQWPGRDGAVKVAAELQARLGPDWIVRWSLPPDGAKDVRAWVQARHMDPTVADEWSEAGDCLVERIRDQLQVPGEAAAGAAHITVIDSEEFARTDYPLSWHVRKVLVRGQPAIVGGPKKCLKTSVLCDLAISIGAGLPFLGHFESLGPTRVGFLSGESGPHTIQDTARNVCKARGIDLSQAGVWWGFAVPQLSRPDHLDCLAAIIRDHELQAIILDPLYLCLLAGNRDAQAGNLFDMGPLLAEVANVCLSNGATPLLCHHNVKRPPDPLAVPELEDLAFAGIQEFARQWLLLGRREKYDVGSGLHRLWLNIGGSVGFSSCWGLDIDEGVIDDDFGGKKWEATVTPASEVLDGKRAEKERQRDSKLKEEDGAVLAAIDSLTREAADAPTYTRVRSRSGFGGDKFNRIVERLLTEDLVEVIPLAVTTGNGTRKEARGLRRKHPRPG